VHKKGATCEGVCVRVGGGLEQPAERRENSFEKGRWPTRLSHCTTGVTQKYVRIALTAIRESDIFALCDQGQQHAHGRGSEIQYCWRPRKKYDACRRTAAGFLITIGWDERGIAIWYFVRGTRTPSRWPIIGICGESLATNPCQWHGHKILISHTDAPRQLSRKAQIDTTLRWRSNSGSQVHGRRH
jgi:hypothetical protein